MVFSSLSWLGVFLRAATLVLLSGSAAIAAPVVLSGTDKHASVLVSEDALGVDFTYWDHRAIRSTEGIQPGSGIFYYEGHREVAAANFGFGVASPSAPLDTFGGFDSQSLGVNALGYVYYNNASQLAGVSGAIVASDTYGIAVDYRGVNPVVYVIVSDAVLYSRTLDSITGELFILVYGTDAAAGIQQTINAGGDIANRPFAYDVASALAVAGVSNANEVVLGWQVAGTQVSISGGNVSASTGATVMLTAAARNAEGADISATISWEDTSTGQTSVGASFAVSDTVPSTHIVNATVINEAMEPVTDSVTITFAAPDADGDGLSDAEEQNLGTDPADDDSDDDGVLDGDEVNTYSTNPLAADTDGDGMPDGYEITHNLLPLVDDAGLDADSDTYTNLAEYTEGTDPHSAQSYPGAVPPATLNAADRHASVTLSADLMGAIFSEYGAHRAVRSTIAIAPQSGFYYYEGHREVAAGDFGFGVATAAETLAGFGGSSDQSMGVNALGYIFYNGSNQIAGDNPQILASDTIGIAVDYRGIHPVAYVIVAGQLLHTQPLPNVADPLYIFVYGHSTTAGIQQTINTGGNLATAPFEYDAASILATAGVAGTASLQLGWRAPQPVTRINVVEGNVVANVGANVQLTSSALNASGVDISASTVWLDELTGVAVVGATFQLTSATAGVHTITATVQNEMSQPVVAQVTVTFTDPDSDGDGLSDQQEALLGTNPNNSDSDADGLADGVEVNTTLTDPLNADSDADGLLDGYEQSNGLDPLDPADASQDADNDGYSNSQEHAAGTDPNNPASYPGAPAPARLSETDRHQSVSVSPDGLGASFSMAGHHGVRSDLAIEQHSGFYYFEGHREVAAGNYGFGVATADAALDNFGGASNQSLGVNALGFVFFNNISQVSDNTDISSAEYYGLAVDYRGDHPVVHVIANGALVYTQVMSAVTSPLHILVYGNPVAAGIQQTINTAHDLQNQPFFYDAETILATAGIAGADQLVGGWTPPPPVTEIQLNTQPQQLQVGQSLVLTASARNASGIDISNDIAWSDSASAQQGTGASFEFVANSLGLHIISAQVLNENAQPVTATVSITVVAADSDNDGLSDDQEALLGTSPVNADTDGDGVLDGQEVNQHGTNPLSEDTDGDGVPDGVEVSLGSNPLLEDGNLDSDGDGFSNLDEIAQGTDPGNRYSYPGGPVGAVLNADDAHGTVLVGASGLGVTFTDSAMRSIRSTVAIAPRSGWYYFEGRRLTAKGSVGFGVASALASTDAGVAADGQSVGISTNGNVYFNGVVAQAYADAVDNEYYGVAVDYTGVTPVVYFVVQGADGYRAVLTPRPLPGVTGDLYIFVFGQAQTGAMQAMINAGDDPEGTPFHYPAHYEIFTAGYTGAEFLGNGWGQLHTYSGVESVEQQSEVRFTVDGNTGAGIQLSADGLSAAYDIDLKMGVRANQGMIGEFRYYEGIRLLDNIVKLGDGEGLGFGYGLITGYGRINPYPFEPEQPSMSLNSVNGIWRNLNFITTFDTSTYYHGFAVDYRGARPVVHVIINDEVVHTMTLPDVFTPLYPLIYGNTQGQGVFANAANFGATPFQYDPKAALERAGVDTQGFVSGWGDVNRDTDADNLRDSAELVYGTQILDADSDGDTLRDGDEVHRYGLSPVSDDSDNDGMPDGYELAVGQNPLVDDRFGDIDNDGINNQAEYLVRSGLANAAPVLRIHQGNISRPIGQAVVFSATAADLHDGDLKSAIQWSLYGQAQSANGATFSLNLPEGVYRVDAMVTDSDGESSLASVTLTIVDPSSVDTDGDGLSDQQESNLGTNPNLADTDGDGLGDAEEVAVTGTNPLLADTDADGMLDAFEVNNNLDPLNAADAALDNDGDGRTNLEESLIGSDPNVADPAAVTDIIIDNEDDGAVLIAGTFSTYVADEQYGSSAAYASVGGVVDRFRFTPAIEQAGNYEVFAWNSCYSDRATDVRHVISHAGGLTVVNVDQDCDTGSHGEWFSLGIYSFALGQSGYLEITDEGLSGPTYMGADAARFTLVDSNFAPVLEVSETSVLTLAGQTVALTATAQDAEDGDLTASISWRENGVVVATGASFEWMPPLGSYVITVSVSDSEGKSAVRLVNVAVVEDDNDGLSPEEEALLGTNPADADSDDDGVTDGDEVHLHGTDPLAADSDSDGISDGVEIGFGFNPLDPSDAALDSDGDGISNLQEVQNGTDPLVPEPLPLADIIMDTDDAGISESAGWNAFYGSESYNETSRWAVVGGAVERFRFTPTIPQAGQYEVFAWNACYSDRATDVRHVVQHALGTTTIEVDQDCDTGSHGEWYSLGVFEFTAGTSGYVEITDEGMSPAATTYMGADAVRFTQRDGNAAPVLMVSNTAVSVLVGQEVQLTASASDAEEGDLSATIEWDDGEGATQTGASFAYVPALGVHAVTVSVADSQGRTTSVVVSVSAVADDNDGLTPEQEALIGTDPAVADTDGDGVSDGDEVNVFGTNPLLVDSDQDGLSDGFEVTYGLDPLDAGDALADDDGDGISNLDEFLNGTDPTIPEPVPAIDIIIDNGDAGTSASGAWSAFAGNESYNGASLWAAVGGGEDRYRFTPDIPQAGYYEVFAWNSCYSDRAVNVRHIVQHQHGTTVIEVDQDCDTGTHGEWYSLGVFQFVQGSLGYLEITDAGIPPGPATYMGADAARFLQVDGNQPPQLTTSAQQVSLVFGETLQLSALAQDAEEGDLTTSIAWSNNATADVASGANYSFVPVLGASQVVASVVDSEGATTSVVISVMVVASAADLDDDLDGLSNADEALLGTDPANADSDSDGVSDGDEVQAHGTDPLAADTDMDGMPDGFEIQYGLDPQDSADASLDADSDGVSNLDEFGQGTDPTAAPVVDIVMVNGDVGTSQSGTWNLFPGNESYDVSSLWAEAGGAVDRYRFTPTIEAAGVYEVLVWNSCYSNRAVNVPHVVQHALGVTTIDVDQDCDTGTHGEWYSLGVYSLDAGTDAYLEISDEGLSGVPATYIGADAARFIRQ